MIKLVNIVKEILSESNEFRFQISRKEEALAMEFIKKILVPELVKNFNIYVYPRDWYKSLTEQEVLRNLRKVKHKRGKNIPYSYDRDEIKYESKVDYGPLRFAVYKAIKEWEKYPDGILLAGYSLYSHMAPHMKPVKVG